MKKFLLIFGVLLGGTALVVAGLLLQPYNKRIGFIIFFIGSVVVMVVVGEFLSLVFEQLQTGWRGYGTRQQIDNYVRRIVNAPAGTMIEIPDLSFDIRNELRTQLKGYRGVGYSFDNKRKVVILSKALK